MVVGVVVVDVEVVISIDVEAQGEVLIIVVPDEALHHTMTTTIFITIRPVNGVVVGVVEHHHYRTVIIYEIAVKGDAGMGVVTSVGMEETAGKEGVIFVVGGVVCHILTIAIFPHLMVD